MSDLEEENRDHSDRGMSSERNEDQKRLFLDRDEELFAQARMVYEAIQIPGELNTRVRAVIESDYERKKTVQMISETDVNDSEHIRQFNLSVNK